MGMVVDIMTIFSISMKENISDMFRQAMVQIEEYKSAFSENIDTLNIEIAKILEELDRNTQKSEELERRVKENRALASWVGEKETRIRELLTF